MLKINKFLSEMQKFRIKWSEFFSIFIIKWWIIFLVKNHKYVKKTLKLMGKSITVQIAFGLFQPKFWFIFQVNLEEGF